MWTPARWAAACDALDRVLDLDAAARRRAVDALAPATLRADVRRLLDAEAPAFLDAEAAAFAAPLLTALADDDPDAPGADDDFAGRPPAQIGPYRLGDVLGAGGMGVVYRAERVDGAFRQTVAVKLMRRAAALTPSARQRFAAERHVLAALNHPHVARLLDGGVTDDGTPFLVMEYVRGTPLDAYVRARALDLDARLALVEQAADAVQAAHRQLVVHRDLKPSNLLVTEDDAGRPQVKLLDFGIAKLLGDTLGAAPVDFTVAATRAGAVAPRAAALLDLDRALTHLATLDARLARVVEMKFFGGMTEEEIGAVLTVSARTVQRDWRKAKRFLADALDA